MDYSGLIAAPILIENRPILIKVWAHMFVIYLTVVSFTVPYCAAFSSEDDTYNICHFWFGWFTIFVNVIDVLIEILGAAPVTGIYYKLVDGFYTVSCQFTFYLDVISCIPFEYLYIFPLLDKLTPYILDYNYDLSDVWFPIVLRSFCKIWKIFRYFKYLDNRPDTNVVLIRFLKVVVTFPICIQWSACSFFWMACPNGWGKKCRDINWMDVDFLKSDSDVSANLVTNVNQFSMAYYFASITLTSVGFGDYTPQTSYEMIWTIMVMIIGVFFTMYLMAGITSALTARIRNRLIFHQKIEAMKHFMYQYGLGESIQERVLEHYNLQHQLRYEVPLPNDIAVNNLMFDAPKELLDDAVYTEYLPFLEGVTIFSKCNPEIIIRAGKMLKRYLLPPSITFMDAGEVRREMYIVFKGSIALYTHPDDEVPTLILDATGYHGIRDLLYGEPCQYTVRTVGHVILLAIDFKMVNDLLSEEKFFIDFMAQSCVSDFVLIIFLCDVFNASAVREEEDIIKKLSSKKYFKDTRHNGVPLLQPSWIEYPKHESDYSGNIFRTTVEEYDEPFRRTKYGNLIKLFMLPFTIHPSGIFATCWVILQSINCTTLLLTLIMETIMDYRPPWLRVTQILIDIVNSLDIYVKLHWAYYDLDGTLYYHPIRTFLKSVYHGNFFFDLCLLCPAELIVYMYGATDIYGYGSGYRWYSLLRWGRFFRFYKMPEACWILYDSFIDKGFIVILGLYCAVYFIFTMILTMFAVNTACPKLIVNWNEGDEYRLPACSLGSWITVKKDAFDHLKAIDPNYVGFEEGQGVLLERLLLGYYYVSQVILVIGYGDTFTKKADELPYLMFLIIVGTFIYQFMIADLSSSMIDSNQDRHIFREQRNRLITILKREDVHKRLSGNIRRHFRHTWAVTRGIQPRDLFRHLHPILEGDLFQEFVGEVFNGIPLFQEFGSNCIRAMSKIMRQESFSAGQRMARFGNMEYQLYVIVDGDVYITDQNLRWKCTLTRGEMFGELSLIYGVPRHYSAFAANNVEAYVISADDFANLLQLYPELKANVVSALTEEGVEYVEIKYRAKQVEDNDKYCKDKEIFTEIIRQIVSENETRLVFDGNEATFTETKKPFWSNIIGISKDSNVLPRSQFLYFTGKYMIHPLCKCMTIFSTIVMAIRILSPALESYKVYFYHRGIVHDPVTDFVLSCTSIFERVFLVHIIVNFFTALELERGLFCVQYSRVIANYLLRPRLFLLDFLSSLPVQYFGGHNTRWLLIRFLRLPEYFRYLWTARHDLDVSNLRFKISISLSAFFIVSHVLACAFYAVACASDALGKDDCVRDSWVEELKYEFLNRKGREMTDVPSMWYIRSYYWVMSTLTTTGFGDITPNNAEEIEISILAFIFCAFGMCILIGNVTTGLQSWYQARREFFYYADIFCNHLGGIGLSKDYQQLLMTYYTIKWHNARGVSYVEAISVLPLSLQFDVCTAIYYKCVQKCKFFGLEKDASLLRNICARLTHDIFLPGNIIMRQGNLEGKVFVVFKGEVSSYRIDKITGQPTFLKKYGPNIAFGKVPALFRNVSYNKTYRAEGYVEVISLHQNDIKHIAKNYPRWKLFLKRLVAKRYPNLIAELFISNIFEHRKEKPKK